MFVENSKSGVGWGVLIFSLNLVAKSSRTWPDTAYIEILGELY